MTRPWLAAESTGEPLSPLAFVHRRYPRRALLHAARRWGGAALLTTALGGCAARPGASRRWGGRFLTVATTGGALRQALAAAMFVPFSRETGCRVMDVVVSVDDMVRELRRQVLVGVPEWDVVAIDLPRLAALSTETPALLDRITGPAASGPGGGAASDFGVTILSDTLALACRTGPLAGRAPADWPSAWETDAGAFPGPRAYPRDPLGLLEIALLADGADPARLYPLDLARAFGSLGRLFPAIRLWWRQPDRVAEALTYGEADLILARGGDLRAAIGGGAVARLAPLPLPMLPLALGLPRGAPNGDVAREFLSAARGSEAQASLANAGYAPVAELDAPSVPDETAPPAFPLDLAWWQTNGTEAFARFAAWLNQ